MSDLAVSACRSVCSWAGTGVLHRGERLFACSGCGSEWVRSEPWTPVDWTGAVPDEVQAERSGS